MAATEPEDILQEIKIQLLNVGEHAFVDMVETMKSFGKGDKMSKIELMNALTKSGVFLSLVQLSTLIRTFDVDGTSQLSISAFSKSVQGDFSNRRLALLQKIFNKIDKNGNKKIEYKEMMAQFNPAGHPSVKASILSEDIVEDRMKIVFEGAEKKGYLTIEDFLQYYSRMNATVPASDDLFCEIVSGVWGVPEKAVKISRKDHPKVKTMLNILKEKVRQKSNTHLGNINTTLYKWFKFFDKNKNETISYSEWVETLERLGVVVGKDISKEVFHCFAGEDKQLEYKEFTEWLFCNTDSKNLGKDKTPQRRLIS